MKKIIVILSLLFCITANAQTTPFDKNFKRPDSLILATFLGTSTSVDDINTTFALTSFLQLSYTSSGVAYNPWTFSSIHTGDLLKLVITPQDEWHVVEIVPIGAVTQNPNTLYWTGVRTQSENDIRYLQSESDPTFNTKFATKTSDNLAEGSTNKYVTTSDKTNWNAKLSSEVDGSVTNEIELPSQSGQSGKFLSTNGSTTTWVNQTLKRQETYTGTTAGSGTYTVTYGTAYSIAPNVQFNINGGTTTNTARLTSSSTTGFTITANNRVEVLGLLPTYPTLNGLVIDVLVTEK